MPKTTQASTGKPAPVAERVGPARTDALTPLADIRGRLPQPVTIARFEVIDPGAGDHLVRVYDADGDFGTSYANVRMPNVISLFETLVAPWFVGRDARDLATMPTEFYYAERMYKFLGMPLWTNYAFCELACLDLLGRKLGFPTHELLGVRLRERVPVYMSSLSRATTPEEEVAFIAGRMAIHGASACKLKIGGRMSRDADASPGRTERLIALARRTLGDEAVIYVDANGSYSAEKAIEVGRMLEDHGVGFFEEPCEWPDFRSTKRVADALAMTVAGGEQDHDLHKWRWMIEERAVDLVQPDVMYNGGLVRAIEVANVAGAHGVACTSHNPRNDAGLAPMLALAAVLPNLGAHQEYRAKPNERQAWASPVMECVDGEVAVPMDPGLGVTYDEAYLARMKRVLTVAS